MSEKQLLDVEMAGHGQFLRTDEILQKKAKYGRMAWIVHRNEETIVFLQNGKNERKTV